jgi:multidrug efflux pump subunit AcrA (membrane-fusion protein)
LSLVLRNSRRRLLPWTWVRNLILATAVTGGLTAAAYYPVDLTIDARGELQPAVRRHVFANADGIIDQLYVATGDVVQTGQVLAELRSPELEIEYQRVQGELETARQRLASLEASRLDARLRGNEDLARLRELTSQMEETRQTISSFENQQVILDQRRRDLKVVSPLDGEVLTWDVERQLGRRPVMRGQRLLTVAARTGPWQLEVRVDDDYAGDLHRNFRPGGPPVRVDYVLATAPDQPQTARLGAISATAEVRTAGEGATLLCTVPVEPGNGLASAGLGARARIHCGQHPLGYVWFRDLWRIFRTNVLFPLGW